MCSLKWYNSEYTIQYIHIVISSVSRILFILRFFSVRCDARCIST